MKSHAVEDNTFGVRTIPQKLIENSDGILQIYALHNDHIFPEKIDNVISSSTDSSIVQVIGTEKNNTDFITNIKLKTLNQGTAKIELGAPGFSSKEVPLTVYGNTNYPTKLLVQSTPSIFSIDGPHIGYFTVELANTAGSPVISSHDVIIKITLTDNRVLTLSNKQIVIKGGDYFVTCKFEIKQVGTTQIFASVDSFPSVSATITVNQMASPTIQTYIYPQKINNYAASIGYVIAQLKDSSGVLAPAKEDITIPVSIIDPNANLTNSSPIIQNVEAHEPIVIKKGSYWGYTNLSVKAAANGTYTVRTYAPNGYVTPGNGQVSTYTTKFYDDKSAKLDILPILSTGNKELIGILHLEDTNGNPIIASHDLQIEIDSTDPNSLKVDPVNLSKGSGVALVFAKVGTSIPTSLSLHVVTYNDQTVSPVISSPTSNSLTLVAQSLVPEILSNSNFPIAVYLSDSSGAPTYFLSDSTLNALNNDYFSVQKSIIDKGDSIKLANASALKDGSSNVNIIAENYQTSISLKTVSTLPKAVVLGYTNPLLLNMPNTMNVQIFDSNANPVFAQKDITLKLVSGNKEILTLPENITISKGHYYTKFEITPSAMGSSQVSIFADDLPLTTYNITTDTLSPTMNWVTPNSTSQGNTIIASIVVKDHGDPLKNMKIQWNVKGANIQNSDSLTNQNGTANIVLVSNSDNPITVLANATGLGYVPVHTSKTIPLDGMGLNKSSTNSTNSKLSQSGIQSILKSFRVNGLDTLPIVVLGTITIGGILIKKNGILFGKKIRPSSGMQTK